MIQLPLIICSLNAAYFINILGLNIDPGNDCLITVAFSCYLAVIRCPMMLQSAQFHFSFLLKEQGRKKSHYGSF
jgi:hypothetical protein